MQNDRVTVNGELERAWTRLTCSKILLQHLPEVKKKTCNVQMNVRLRFEGGASQIQIPSVSYHVLLLHKKA